MTKVELEKEVTKLRRRNARLEHMSGLLWVFRCDPTRPAMHDRVETWAALEEAHDKHRHAIMRGR